LKHTNACGVATRSDLLKAWEDALACDPVSAFGGVIICNGEIDEKTANEINKLFFEVLIAPAYSDGALRMLTSKKSRILLRRKHTVLPKSQFKTLLNGVIEQDKDAVIEGPEQMQPVTDKSSTYGELEDLIFANNIFKHTKSSPLLLVKNGQSSARVVGRASRVDALKQAIEKASSCGFGLHGAVM